MPAVAINDLLDALGSAALKALIEAKSGQAVWVSKTPAGWMIAAMGEVAAKKLCANYGGEQLVIPVGRAFKSADLQNRIEELRKQGATINQIAEQLRLHSDTVYKRLSDIADPNQLTLFEVKK